MTKHTKWTTIRHKSQPKISIMAELDAMKAGDSAFRIRVPFYNNPYTETSLKNAWIRGFKRAERDWNESVRNSIRVQETIGLEEVEA